MTKYSQRAQNIQLNTNRNNRWMHGNFLNMKQGKLLQIGNVCVRYVKPFLLCACAARRCVTAVASNYGHCLARTDVIKTVRLRRQPHAVSQYDSVEWRGHGAGDATTLHHSWTNRSSRHGNVPIRDTSGFGAENKPHANCTVPNDGKTLSIHCRQLHSFKRKTGGKIFGKRYLYGATSWKSQ